MYMPTFNFITGTKEYKGNSLKLGPEDVLVIEGIHCLNDALSYSLPAENKFKIYVSALTQMNIDEHNRDPDHRRTTAPQNGSRCQNPWGKCSEDYLHVAVSPSWRR